MGPGVRVATADDAADVARLFAGFRDWMGKDEPTTAAIASTLERLLEDEATEFLLADADGEGAAGLCQLRFRLSVWTGTPDCWLEDLYVEEGARRRGLGAALVAGAIERAAARGCRRIELDVSEDNEAALALYRAMGFTTEPKPPGRSLFVGRRIE